MKRVEDGLRLSASDLSNHLGCRHLTRLDRDVALGRRSRPDSFDPTLQSLRERGLLHEAAYLRHLAGQGLEVVTIPPKLPIPEAQGRTLEAVRAGAPVIAQAAMVSGGWLGYADVLLRVEVPSGLGSFSYQAQDTKLSRETKAGAVLQLALYSDILEEMQGTRPESMWVVSPGAPFNFDKLRFEDFRAYYRWTRSRLEAMVGANDASPVLATSPEPVAHCESCSWSNVCESDLRKVDHVSFVAGVTRSQRRELSDRNVVTLAGLASLALPLPFRPERGSVESLTRAREQARIQHEGRTSGQLKYELLPVEADRGLSLLPEPSVGDIFFDFEGDPFVEGGGLEYLFGYAYEGTKYRSLWALSRTDEKTAFETFVDDVMARWEVDAGMHVYHFAPYEPAALRRLMGRHGTREQEVDRMLRGGLFVDLYTVVRQGLRASVESYSIKKLEPFFGFERDVPLPDVGPSKRALEAALELVSHGAEHAIEPGWRDVVEAYNRDDCFAAMKLRDWVESLRAQLEQSGTVVSRPEHRESEPSEKVKDSELRIFELKQRLLEGVPEAAADRSRDENALVLMASLVDFHRREDKVVWWERYRLKDLPEAELEDEPRALVGLEHLQTLSTSKQGIPTERYRFPQQVVEAKIDDEALRPDAAEDEGGYGKVVAIDRDARTVDIKKTKKTAKLHANAVIFHKRINPEPLPTALLRVGDWIAAKGVDADGEFRAARDLLLRTSPRLRTSSKGLARLAGETALDQSERLAEDLDTGVLPIQGPPGAGKTFTGARMIAKLVAAGKKVGVTAMSHKVVLNLLNEVRKANPDLRCLHKATDLDPNCPIVETADNHDALDAIATGRAQVLGGTPWLWAREDAQECVDVLFIDEAGQLSLANALAVAGAAKSLVLLGDPRQLEQPKRGAHPDGAEVSALEHLLGDETTVAEERGLFLEETWRLHPRIAEFTSQAFYAGRLRSRPELETQSIKAGPIIQPGLWSVAVRHRGRSNESPEEVAAVCRLVEEVLAPDSSWTDADGRVHSLTAEDLLIVAPYNAQVDALERALPGMRIGTVDRFQGQEAALVIVSMTSSSAEDAPRGMEFLFSLNRVNVATSRARAACVLVFCAELLEGNCRTPRHLKLTNTLCGYQMRSNRS